MNLNWKIHTLTNVYACWLFKFEIYGTLDRVPIKLQQLPAEESWGWFS